MNSIQPSGVLLMCINIAVCMGALPYHFRSAMKEKRALLDKRVCPIVFHCSSIIHFMCLANINWCSAVVAQVRCIGSQVGTDLLSMLATMF